jgi:hypothetical protein
MICGVHVNIVSLIINVTALNICRKLQDGIKRWAREYGPLGSLNLCTLRLSTFAENYRMV